MHVFNGNPYTLNSGCVCFVRDHDRHLFEQTDGLILTNILFRAPDAFRFVSGVEQFLPREADGVYPAHWRISQQVLQQVKGLIAQLAAAPAGERPEEIALHESVFMQLLVQLWQGCLARQGTIRRGVCISCWTGSRATMLNRSNGPSWPIALPSRCGRCTGN